MNKTAANIFFMTILKMGLIEMITVIYLIYRKTYRW